MQFDEVLYTKKTRLLLMGALVVLLAVGAVLYTLPLEHPRALKNAAPL